MYIYIDIFQAVGATEELVYVAQADSSRRVQNAARKALTSLSKSHCSYVVFLSNISYTALLII